MATSSREARRKKILERGSDRLGLITGRIQNIPPPPPPSDSQPDLQNSSEPSDSHADIQQPPLPSDKFNVSSYEEDKTFDHVPPEHNTVAEVGANADDSRSKIEPTLPEIETLGSEVRSKTTFSTISSVEQNTSASSSAAGQNVVRHPSIKAFCNPKQINSAIAVTEKLRLVCSAAVAFFIVLSCLGFPLMGSDMVKPVITYRPLYLVLLTNVTVVIARLLFDKQKGSENASRIGNLAQTTDENGWAEQVSKLLETAFTMQKILDAIFMDCSVYASIVICGLAFAW